MHIKQLLWSFQQSAITSSDRSVGSEHSGRPTGVWALLCPSVQYKFSKFCSSSHHCRLMHVTSAGWQRPTHISWFEVMNNRATHQNFNDSYSSFKVRHLQPQWSHCSGHYFQENGVHMSKAAQVNLFKVEDHMWAKTLTINVSAVLAFSSFHHALSMTRFILNPIIAGGTCVISIQLPYSWI